MRDVIFLKKIIRDGDKSLIMCGFLGYLFSVRIKGDLLICDCWYILGFF